MCNVLNETVNNICIYLNHPSPLQATLSLKIVIAVVNLCSMLIWITGQPLSVLITTATAISAIHIKIKTITRIYYTTYLHVEVFRKTSHFPKRQVLYTSNSA